LTKASPKPNKKLILALCLVAGVFVGIFVALIMGAVEKRKQELEAAS